MSAEPPSSRDGVVWSVPTAAARAGGARPWVHVVGALLVLGGPILFAVGIGWGDRSLDVPLPNDLRLGLYGFDLPQRWVCEDGHDHWSAPFWLGAAVVTGAGAAVWRLLARRFRR